MSLLRKFYGAFEGLGGHGDATAPPEMGRGETRQPVITTLTSDRNAIATPIIGMERLRPPKQKRDQRK